MSGKVTEQEIMLSGAAKLDIAAYRTDFEFIFDLDGYDAGSKSFYFRVFESRGDADSTLFTGVSVSVETQTFQHWIDQGYFTKQQLPPDALLTDNYPITTFTLSAGTSDMQALPKTTEDGFEKTVLHYELYVTGTFERIVEGDFIVFN